MPAHPASRAAPITATAIFDTAILDTTDVITWNPPRTRHRVNLNASLA
jgi:hypothetical protein